MSVVVDHEVQVSDGSLEASVGSVVAVASVVGLVRGVLLAWEGPLVVLLDHAGVVVRVQPQGPVQVVEEAPQGLVDRLAAACAREFAGRVDQLRDHQVWRDRLVQAAHEAADAREWCSDFDDLMESLGLPRRQRDYEVVVEFSGQVRLDVTASSGDDATEAVDQASVLEAILRGLQGSYLNVDIDSVEAD